MDRAVGLGVESARTKALRDVQVVVGSLSGEPAQVEAKVNRIEALTIGEAGRLDRVAFEIFFGIADSHGRDQLTVQQFIRQFAEQCQESRSFTLTSLALTKNGGISGSQATSDTYRFSVSVTNIPATQCSGPSPLDTSLVSLLQFLMERPPNALTLVRGGNSRKRRVFVSRLRVGDIGHQVGKAPAAVFHCGRIDGQVDIAEITGVGEEIVSPGCSPERKVPPPSCPPGCGNSAT